MSMLDRGRDVGHQVFYSACYAPFTSMYLDPLGDVRACCMNRWQRLGTITEQSLSEIWHGSQAALLRASLRHSDLGRGCEACAQRIELGNPEGAFLRVYDSLRPPSDEPQWPIQLELALSNACNLQCVMCNGELSSSIRIHREHRPALARVYDEAFFRDLDHFLPHLERMTLLGGEPFLATESLLVMERLVERGLRPQCHVTTNGTQTGPRVERLIGSLPMHIAISIDGATATTNEAVRVGVSHAELIEGINRLRAFTSASGGSCSLSFSLMTENWSEFGQLLSWADSEDLDVFVNTVTAPPRYSIQHLATDVLESVIGELEAEDRLRGPTLQRNRPVWEHELTELRRALEDRRSPGTGVALPRRSRPVAERADAAIVVADRNQIVCEVLPAVPADGLGLEELVGHPLNDVQTSLVALLGPISESLIDRASDGIEHRTVVFDGDGGRTTLDLTMQISADGGERWQVTTRSNQPRSVAGPQPTEQPAQ